MRKILLLLLCVPMLVCAKSKKRRQQIPGRCRTRSERTSAVPTDLCRGRQKQTADIRRDESLLNRLMKGEQQMKGTKMAMEESFYRYVGRTFEEWMIFKKKPFVLDRTCFRYLLTIKCSNGKCHMELTQISYYYEEDLDGYNGRTYKAEEWINDANALNKAKNKLL